MKNEILSELLHLYSIVEIFSELPREIFSELPQDLARAGPRRTGGPDGDVLSR
jgi:hypothetical protein